ncbi:hypothetical protein QYF36_008419 [Acer negundo]|nr:hypothetical protein QYF36_008419 [Acer negundo]
MGSFFDVKDQKLCANSHWISVVLNSDGYSFKSSGRTTIISEPGKGGSSIVDLNIGFRRREGFCIDTLEPFSAPRQNRINETPLMNLSSLASEKAAEAAFSDTHTVVGPETVGSFPRMNLSLFRFAVSTGELPLFRPMP